MKLRSRLFYSYLFFVILYSAFALLPAPAPAIMAQYHINALELRIIDLTLIILQAIIWFVGFYGLAKLLDYTSLIRSNKDGQQVAKLTRGVFFLVMWLPISAVISEMLNYLARKHPDMLSAVTIINHYVSLLLPLLGFIFIGSGAYGLSKLVRQRPSYQGTSLLAIVIIYLGLVYNHQVLTTYHRETVYHLSVWLILTTLTAPYIYMWAIGLLAAYWLYQYQKKVAGILYRKSWRLLAFGIAWLVLTSVSFQYLTTLSVRLSGLSIYWLLAIVYLLLLVLSVGFLFIALGTRKLRRIEEV